MAVIATGNREDALDIVQDAMYKLVSRYRERQAEEWPPLFYRILQSTIRDWYRRNSVRNRLRHFFKRAEQQDEADPLENLPAAWAEEPLQWLQTQHAMEALDTALRRLPLRQQQVFLLRQWEGLDVKGTARAMGITTGSVKTHYSRAIHSLRELLEDHRS